MEVGFKSLFVQVKLDSEQILIYKILSSGLHSPRMRNILMSQSRTRWSRTPLQVKVYWAKNFNDHDKELLYQVDFLWDGQ